MSPRGRSKPWNARLRRIATTIDSWPGWVMVLVALACLLLAIWLLAGLHGIGIGSGKPVEHANP